MKEYFVEVDWPHYEDISYLVYAESKEQAEAMVEEVMIKDEWLDPGELHGPMSEVSLIVTPLNYPLSEKNRIVRLS